MHRSTPRAIVLMSMIGSLWAADALADLGPPPTCPDGLTPKYWHGHYCAAIDCTSDAECGGEKCVERPVCLDQRDKPDPEDETGTNTSSTPLSYIGECAGGRKCVAGECVTKKICTTPGATGATVPSADSPAGSKHGCGCAIPGGPVGATFCAFALLGGLGLLLGRRRVRR